MDNYSLNEMLDKIEHKLNGKPNKGRLDNNYAKESQYKSYDSNVLNDNIFSSETFRSTKKPLSYNLPASNGTDSSSEIRKLIERELEPYLFSAKNELRIVIENFTKDITVYKHVDADIRIVKEAVQENKKMILVFKEDLERKFQTYTDKFHLVNRKFEEMKDLISDFNKRVNNFDKMYESLGDKTSNISIIKDKLSILEAREETLFERVNKSISLTYSDTLKSVQSEILNFKGKQNEIENSISELKLFNNQVNDKISTNHKSNESVKNEIDRINEKYNNINSVSSGLASKVDSLITNVSNYADKFTNMKDSISQLKEENLILKSTSKEIKNKLEDLENFQLEEKDDLTNLNLHIKNRVQNEINNLTNTTSQLSDKLNKLSEKLTITAENLNTSISVKIRNLSEDKQESSNNIKEKVSKINDDLFLLNSSFNELNLNYNNIKTNLNNLTQNMTEKTNPVEQIKVNEIFEKSLSGLVKQFVNLSNEVENLKNENTRFEENFDLIQDNFEKLNFEKPERSQNAINEILKTLTINYENMKKTIEEHNIDLENIKKRKAEEVNTLTHTTDLNEVTILIDQKIKECETLIKNSFASSSHTDYSAIISSINDKANENEDKINKMFNYFEPKLEEITDCINLIINKYDNNLITSKEQLETNRIENTNDLENEKCILEIYPSGYANNLTSQGELKFILKTNFVLSEKFINSEEEFMINSKLNDLDENCEKELNEEKYRKNMIYLCCSPMMYSEVKQQLPGYINKYVLVNKNYSNVIEGDLEMEEVETSTRKTEHNGNHNDICENERKTVDARNENIIEELHAIDINEDLLCKDELDSFDRSDDD